MESTLRLTQTVQKGGCAAKVAALELRRILGQVRFPPTPDELLVGGETFDDAAVYRVDEQTALVQTLDFFTPIVDTPKLFGKIASANALSDVYAMGGRPKTAMAIFAFPLATMPDSVAVEVLQGASDIVRESGAAFVGGHTIDDDTMKFGLSVTGYVHPKKVWTNAGAKPGDVLILTKPLGTGTLTAALKRNEVTESQIQDAIDSMCKLNNAVEVFSEAQNAAVHAATDITGFGLAGHALNVARASQVTLELRCQELPRFASALDFIGRGFLTKAHRTNAEYVKEHSRFDIQDESLRLLTMDPQTSGGLLLAVDPSAAQEILHSLQSRFPTARVVGSVSPLSDVSLRFV